MSNQNDSDPLPFLQLDRSSKAMAARLAPQIEVTFQHALGSLAEFWDLNSDPRELMALLRTGKTEVMLAKEEVIRRFRIASGKTVDPLDLVTVGTLEMKNDLFRVRGMSRQFEAVKKRMSNADNAKKGGERSAENRKKKFGSAAPKANGKEGKEAKKPKQAELDGMPPAPPKAPRELSDKEQLHRDYQDTRRVVLEQERNAVFAPDREHSPVFINTALEGLLKELEPYARGGLTGWERLTALWFEQSWAAEMDPPFPFKALISRSVLDDKPGRDGRPPMPGLLTRLRE